MKYATIFYWKKIASLLLLLLFYFNLTCNQSTVPLGDSHKVKTEITFYWIGELTAKMVKVCGIKDGLFGLGDTVRGGKVTDRCEVQSEPKSAVLTTYSESWKITNPVIFDNLSIIPISHSLLVCHSVSQLDLSIHSSSVKHLFLYLCLFLCLSQSLSLFHSLCLFVPILVSVIIINNNWKLWICIKSIWKLRPHMSWYRHHSCVHSACLTSTSFTWLWFSASHCRQFQDAKVQSLPSGHLALYINSCYSMTCGTENIYIAALEASRWGIISTWRKERMAKASQKRFCFSWRLTRSFWGVEGIPGWKNYMGKDRRARSFITGLGMGILVRVALR